MKGKQLLWLALWSLAVVGCVGATDDDSSGGSGLTGDSTSGSIPPGSAQLRFELKQSETAHVRFYWMDDGPLIEFEGHLDHDTDLLALHEEAQESDSMEEIYRVFAPGQEPPQVLLEMDEEARVAREIPPPTEWTHQDSPVEDTPSPASPKSSTPNINVNISNTPLKLAWDWNAEEDWWEDNFCNLSNNKRCNTNKTWSYSGGFFPLGDGGKAVMTGMSASHESHAQIRYYEYTCNQCWLVGTCCKWRHRFTTTATERQWKKYIRYNHQGMAFEVQGLGNTPRVHDANSYDQY